MAHYQRQNPHSSKRKVSVSYIIRDRDEKRHRSGVNSLQYDETLDRLYSAGRDSVIRVWSLDEEANGTRRATFNHNRNAHNQDLDDSAQDDYSLQSMEHHTDWVNDMVLCCNGRNLLSVSNDTTIKVWSAHQGFCLSTLRSHKDYARCLAHARDRDIVASAGFDRMIYLWDIQALTTITATKNTVTTKPLDGSKNSIYSLAINQAGTLVASGSTERVIRLWDPRSRQKLLKLRGHTDNVRCLKFSRDGSHLLSASSDGTVRLWSIPQQRCVSIIRTHDEGVWTIQANEAFSCVYSGGRDGKIFKTDLKNIADTSLVCEEDASILEILLVNKSYSSSRNSDEGSLWVATTNSTIKNWNLDLDPQASEVCRQSSSFASRGELERYKPINQKPNIVIKGNPAVIKYHILNDKRYIITHESDNSVGLYDVLTARKVDVLFRGKDADESSDMFEKEIKDRSKMVYVPNWFTVDLNIGLITIHLDETECLSAWVSAKDYGLLSRTQGQDPKVNLGCLMLQALFEHWPPTFEACENDPGMRNHEVSCNHHSPRDGNSSIKLNPRSCCKNGRLMVGNQYFSIPDHTPIIVSEGNQTLLRFLTDDADNENEYLFLQEIIPPWISDIVIARSQPKFTKIPFFLLPHNDSGIKPLRKERLSASDMLQMRKVVEHVCEKILVNNVDDATQSNQEHSASNHKISNLDLIHQQVDKVDLYCNDQKLDENMDLRTVKHFVWKGGTSDLVIHYMPIK